MTYGDLVEGPNCPVQTERLKAIGLNSWGKVPVNIYKQLVLGLKQYTCGLDEDFCGTLEASGNVICILRPTKAGRYGEILEEMLSESADTTKVGNLRFILCNIILPENAVIVEEEFQDILDCLKRCKPNVDSFYHISFCEGIKEPLIGLAASYARLS